jgi:hypothetical protein
MDRLLHDIDARLDGLVVSDHLGSIDLPRSMRKQKPIPKLQRVHLNILTELNDTLKRRVHAWEANALSQSQAMA